MVRLYPFLNKFPESENKNLVLQMKRSSVSIPMNIAEGSSRRTTREFLSFLSYSLGSGKELEVSLRLSKDLGFLNQQSYDLLNEDLQKLVAKLAALMNHLERKLPPRKEIVMRRIDRGETLFNQS